MAGFFKFAQGYPCCVLAELQQSQNKLVFLDMNNLDRGGVPPSFYDSVDPSYNLGAHGSSSTMTNSQGLKLKTYFWPAQNAKCVLIFVHGHGSHLQFELLRTIGPSQPSSYENSWAETFNKAGISVCGIDNQGCGASEALLGLRFYSQSFNSYVDDVLQFARLVSEIENTTTTTVPHEDTTTATDDNKNDNSNVPHQGFSGLPIFITGISLGGCITFSACLRSPELFKGMILLAPMLSLERVSRKGLNPYLRPVADLLSSIIPSAELVATDKNTLYPSIQEMWDKDPWTCHGNTRVRNASEYLKATEYAMNNLDKIELPMILFHSENDTMTDSDGSKQLYLRAKVC